MAKIKLQGSAGLGGTVVVTAGTNSTTKHIQSFPACTVTIYDAGTLNLSSLWSDSGGVTPKSNPFTASASDASWSAYVTAGNYDVRFSGTGIDTPFTIGDVIAVDPATGVPTTRILATTAPLRIDGGASADLSANRTLSVNVFSSGASGIVPASGGGTTNFLRADGTWTSLGAVSPANPTASVGLTAVNGVAPTFLRSDGAPPLDQSIAPIWTGLHTFRYSDAVTNAITDVVTIGHNSSGTPAANFGGGILFNLESSTTENRNAARVSPIWNTATDASRSSSLVLQTVQNGGALTERMRIGGSRTGYDVGFGTNDPLFNDDWSTGANVGIMFAIDGATSGYSAYLGLGGTIPGVTDRVGVLNFYNKSMGGVDNRTATISSYNDGALGQGNILFATSPNNVGPVDRVKIAYDGSVRLGNINTAGGTLGVSTLTGNTQTQQWFNSSGTLTGSFTNLGNLVLGNVNQPSTGGTPVIVLAKASGNPTAIAANSAGLVAKDVAGTTELFAWDDAGNVTQISPHAMDGPNWLYDEDDLLPHVVKEENVYLGVVRWINKSRQARLVERLLAGENTAALPEKERTCIYTERYAPTEDWDANQERQLAAREAELREWSALPDDEKTTKPKPQPHVKVDKPKWLQKRERGGVK